MNERRGDYIVLSEIIEKLEKHAVIQATILERLDNAIDGLNKHRGELLIHKAEDASVEKRVTTLETFKSNVFWFCTGATALGTFAGFVFGLLSKTFGTKS